MGNQKSSEPNFVEIEQGILKRLCRILNPPTEPEVVCFHKTRKELTKELNEDDIYMALFPCTEPHPVHSLIPRPPEIPDPQTEERIPDPILRVSRFYRDCTGKTLVWTGGINTKDMANEMIGRRVLKSNPEKFQWEFCTNIPQHKHRHSAGFHGGFVYIFGGADHDDQPLSDCFKYELGEPGWHSIANLNVPRKFHSTALVENKFYTLGGMTHDFKLLDSIEVYDVEEENWTIEEITMCCPRMAIGAVALGQNIWVVGGIIAPENGMLFSSEDADSEVYVVSDVLTLNTKTRQWTFITSAGIPLCFASVAILDSCLIIVGGLEKIAPEQTLVSSNKVFSYDFSRHKRYNLPNLPTGCHAAQAQIIENRLYVMGGMNSSTMASIPNTYVLDLEKWPGRKWIAYASFPYGLMGGATLITPMVQLH